MKSSGFNLFHQYAMLRNKQIGVERAWIAGTWSRVYKQVGKKNVKREKQTEFKELLMAELDERRHSYGY